MNTIEKLFLCIVFICVCNIKSLSQTKAVFLTNETVWADSILESFSNEQKIAQLFMVAAYSNKGERHKQEIMNLIEKYQIGGLMFLQGGPIRQAKLTNQYQSKSEIPLMIAIDAEWGLAMRLDSTLSFPWQMTLGAIQDSSLIYEMGKEIARQCKLLGIHINFAPVVDVNSNPKNPIINNRSFGEDPLKVTKMGIAYMKGMQSGNVLACAKHFPGHGDTDSDSHKTLPIVNHSRYRLNKVELVPFRELINNGLGSVMVAHLNIPSLDNTKNLPSSLSNKIVTGLLKERMNFSGLVITDGLNMKAVTKSYKPGLVDVKALLAGNDVLLFSGDVPKAINAIKEAVSRKEITQEEIDNRCRKILLAKKWMGLDKYNSIDIKKIENEIITSDTRLINKDLVKASLTLLQNYDDLLPLKRLDTLKIASLAIGEESNKFQQMLSNYESIDFFKIKDDASINEKAVLLNELSRYNLVIISIHKSNANPWKSFDINKDVDILLQSIALQSKVIVSIFANPYSINSFLTTSNFDAILLSFQNSIIAQEQTAQAIFGGIPLNGKLPVTTKHFDINSGLNTRTIRMSYVIPAELNVQDNILNKIDSIVNSAINNQAIPGCQILIAKEGKIFFNHSYGYHTYNKDTRVKNKDIYDLASITKIAATLPILMHMVDNNKLSLDQEIGAYLDLDSTNKNKLIVRDILAHQARLLPWIPFYKETLVKDTISGLVRLRDTLYSKTKSVKFPHKVADGIFLHHSFPDSIMMKVYSSDLLDERKYCYSDLGYYLFKKIIENTYDKPLNHLVDQSFYKRLGMENMGYLPLDNIHISRIIPSEEDFEFRGQVLKGYVHDMGAAMQGCVGGHAGLFSNANDLAKLMQMYLQEGEYAEERYLSKDVINEFTKCQYCKNENRRGAGFDKPALEKQEGGPTCKCVSYLSFGHTGFTGTLAWADPSTQIVYIFLSNRTYPDATNTKLLDMNVRTEIMDVIFSAFNEK